MFWIILIRQKRIVEIVEFESLWKLLNLRYMVLVIFLLS